MSAIWLSRQQVADRLGIKPATVSKWCERGLRHARVGQVLRFKSEWVDEFFEAHEIKPDSDTPHADLYNTASDILARLES